MKDKGGELERITGLWTNEKNGNRWLSGKIDCDITLKAGTRIMVFPTREKKSEKSPSYTLVVAVPESAKQDSADADLAF